MSMMRKIHFSVVKGMHSDTDRARESRPVASEKVCQGPSYIL